MQFEMKEEMKISSLIISDIGQWIDAPNSHSVWRWLVMHPFRDSITVNGEILSRTVD